MYVQQWRNNGHISGSGGEGERCPQFLDGPGHRRRIYTDVKAKVVNAVWGTQLI